MFPEKSDDYQCENILILPITLKEFQHPSWKLVMSLLMLMLAARS